ARSSAFSITVRIVSPGANSEICRTALSRIPLRMATSPLSGITWPYSIASKVDFPDPLGPMIPMRSPSFTVNEIFLNSGSALYLFDSPCALIIGGKCLALPCWSETIFLLVSRGLPASAARRNLRFGGPFGHRRQRIVVRISDGCRGYMYDRDPSLQ